MDGFNNSNGGQPFLSGSGSGLRLLGATAAPTLPPEEVIPADSQSLTRRQKSSRRVLAKIDSAYATVHALEIMSNLLSDARSYLDTVSHHDFLKQGVDWKALQLPRDCLDVAIDGLGQHGSIISQAIVNSSDTKEVQYAQRN